VETESSKGTADEATGFTAKERLKKAKKEVQGD